MPPELNNEEQINHYLTQVFGAARRFRAIPFDHCWVCQATPSPEQIARREHLGLGSYLVDRRTGVVTTIPSSTPPHLAGKRYDESVRAGRPQPGRQIYPHLSRVIIRRTREDPTTIEYQVRIESLAQPPEPAREYPLEITKTGLACRPATPPGASVAAWAQWQARTNGTWPEQGTFEE
jgi:hypothetical protein